MSKRAEQLLGSDIFLALISKTYLEDVRNKDREITEQIALAKEYDKPTFLIYIDLSEVEVKEADELFKEHKVIKILSTTRKFLKQETDPFLKEMRDWCDKNLGNEGGYIK